MDTQAADAPIMSNAIELERSLLDRAKANDMEAIVRMFRQFMSPDEEIYFAEYCGQLGFWILGTHSFACLSNRRLASLQVGAFGRVTYNDGFLEHANSGFVIQPSLLKLYLWAAAAVVFGLMVFGAACVFAGVVSDGLGGVSGLLAGVLVIAVGACVGFLTLWLTVRMYYTLNKCGLLWCIREGISVYVFSNRGRMSRINHLHRLSCQVRDDRLATTRGAP
jgi:hypothetical protein